MDDVLIGSKTALTEQLEREFGLRDAALTSLRMVVNDVLNVDVQDKTFVLKLHNTQSRDRVSVQWEVDLLDHLVQHGVPVVRPVPGRSGTAASFSVAGQARIGVLFEWAPGDILPRDRRSYTLLGKAAAQIHQAADTFTSSLARDAYDYDAEVLIDEQLRRMQRHLLEAHRWDQVVVLGERLKGYLASPLLDRGICHMDPTRANVHLDGENLIVFDFDSAGRCWRAFEPFGVLKVSREFFGAWLDGYRSVRPFGADDERAVAAFRIVGDLQITAWKLGVAESSRAAPPLTVVDLPGVVDGWLAWEREQIVIRP